jgi:hypothetical protein
MVVVAVLLGVNRWPALPPVWGPLLLSLAFAIAAVTMTIVAQAQVALAAPDSLLFLVVFVLGPNLPALPHWVSALLLITAGIGVVATDAQAINAHNVYVHPHAPSHT